MTVKDHAAGGGRKGGTARLYAVLNYNYLIFPVTLLTVFTGMDPLLGTGGYKILVQVLVLISIGGSLVQIGPTHGAPGMGRLSGQ